MYGYVYVYISPHIPHPKTLTFSFRDISFQSSLNAVL